MNPDSTVGIRHIDLSSDHLSPRRAREFVRETLHEWGYENVQDSVALAVSELVTNAVIHTHGETSLTLLDMEGTVQVRLRDQQPTPPRIRVASVAATTGRGLQLIEAVSDHWGVEPAPPGKIVWLDISDT